MFLRLVLNDGPIDRASRFYTPRRWSFETNWRQGLARCLLHLVVLPPAQAKPWPRCLERLLERLFSALTAQRCASKLGSLRRAALGLMPLDSRRTSSSAGHKCAATYIRLWTGFRHALRARVIRLATSFSGQLERMPATLYRAWSRTALPVRLGMTVVAVGLLAASASVPLSVDQQMLMLGAMLGLTVIVRRIAGPAAGVIMMILSVIASSRYIWWRVTQTLEFDSGVEAFFGGGLILAECYTWIVLLLGYVQNARPLCRRPVALPRDRSRWPTVDVYIPTYNEPLSVVKPTVLAAVNLEWPEDKLNIYVLDDGRRAEYREFAAKAGVGYIARPDNAHAKAGNLNNALRITQGEFIAVFDCDHIPVRSFLEMTMGWFEADRRCAMLQTPHHFFSPDPFERNLGTFRRVPSEGSLFYGVTQDGNDLWNAAFFCGSCAVLRRSSLEQVGGIAVETVTEDAHTALKLHRHGYTTAYLRCVLAGGLATESLSGYIGQRMRWARGMAQVFRLDNPFSGKGLNLFQRLCYANSMLHFFSAVPRLIFLVAPLMYLYFDLHIINAAAITLAAYAVPHMLQANLANSHRHGRFRYSFWNGTYEAVLAWYTALPTTLAVLDPRRGKFNVTPKGGVVERDFFDLRIAAPYIVLALLNAIGALIAIPRLLAWNSFEVDTVLVNLIWTLLNLIALGTALGVAAEIRQMRGTHRVSRSMPARLYTERGDQLFGLTEDFSMGGLGFATETLPSVKSGERVTVALVNDDTKHTFSGTVISTHAMRIGIALDAMSIEKELEYVRCTYASPGAWADLGMTSVDRPLTSFVEVLLVAVTGYVRVLQGFSMGLMAWRTGPRSGALTDTSLPRGA